MEGASARKSARAARGAVPVEPESNKTIDHVLSCVFHYYQTQDTPVIITKCQHLPSSSSWDPLVSFRINLNCSRMVSMMRTACAT